MLRDCRARRRYERSDTITIKVGSRMGNRFNNRVVRYHRSLPDFSPFGQKEIWPRSTNNTQALYTGTGLLIIFTMFGTQSCPSISAGFVFGERGRSESPGRARRIHKLTESALCFIFGKLITLQGSNSFAK